MTATAMETELSNTERQALAREATADSYRAGGYVYDPTQTRKAFSDGWDAALEYVKQQDNHWEVAFSKWWQERTAEGYDYGYEPLENVKFGFEAGFEKGHRCRG